MKTNFKNPGSINRAWFVIDAKGYSLGRVAAKAALILRGKHRPYYTPHQEIGDYVIIVNAKQAKMTGNKQEKKIYYRHSGFPGGLKAEPYEKLIARKPVFPMERAVRGMLPKGTLGRKVFQNLKVYAGDHHPHVSQKPEEIIL